MHIVVANALDGGKLCLPSTINRRQKDNTYGSCQGSCTYVSMEYHDSVPSSVPVCIDP